ncbi:alpha/beta fold hydrolase [Streptococcus panodentis]|uniref:Alpha/beta hydrolase n=1 Tax=Streptococcus panodentis TaxID=1581472 RepID=A0ABS5AYD5_9STRE|nr:MULTISPECIES: alpha/beta fold hydrolase [Streptococcus]KXT82117.1 Alpha/beta hydrolase fold [Streptococcus sp. DD11]MBP2621258.1 alpha/beta hydrolase [Streptococcus panodentis]
MPQLFIEESGQENAKSIIFLHASGSSSQMWRHHLAALENDFHCIAVDLPGHGKSSDIEWTDFDEVTDMLAAIIRSKAHGKPHLVGLSLGGSLILKLLEKDAELVDKVIVDGASHQPIKGYRRVIVMVYLMSLLKNRKLMAKLMTKMMQKDGVPKEECQVFVGDLQRAARKSFRRAMSQANRLKVHADFDNPAFFVSGGKESATIHESHQMLAQKNAWSECASYPNKGHAWLFSDVETHIQLLRYFFQNAAFPEKLKRFD